MQGIYRTPLADPALVGVGAGAALGAALATGLAVAAGIVADVSGLLLVAGGATLAAAAAFVVVHRVASASGRVVVATMLLAGLILSAFLVAVTALVVAAGRVPEMGSVAFWTLGSFAGVVGNDVVLVGLVVLPTIVVLYRLGPRLDALALGATEAGHLGVNVPRLTAAVGLGVALLTGVAVVVAGVIAFVGLLVPSLARSFVGSAQRTLVVASALLGATVVVLADVLARSLFSPTEISVGVITTLLGAPFFLWLLLRDRGVVAR
jgi:iron complex transport system permease protein